MGCCISNNSIRNKTTLDQNLITSSQMNASSPRVKRRSFVKRKNSARIQDFDLLEPLGSGGFGTVFKAQDKITGQFRAIKRIEKAKMNLDHIYQEIEILKHLDHPNIVQIFEFIEEAECFYIVMELCSGPNLFRKVSAMDNFSEKQAVNYISQILSATSHCHEMGIIHRDIKPENILFETNDDNALIKMIDFGLSGRLVVDGKLKEIAGTPYFIAPEVINRDYDEKCDMWSIGVVLFIILSGKVPFAAPNTKLLFERILSGVFVFKQQNWKGVSEDAKDFITQLLRKNPSDRLSAAEAFQHPWVLKYTGIESLEDPLDIACMQRLKAFDSKQKLRQAMLAFIASHLSEVSEVQRLRELFIRLDKDKDGKLSREDLTGGFTEIENCTAEDVDGIMERCDIDRDGYIDHTEFVTAALNWEQELSSQKLMAAFKELNVSATGNISVEDIKKFIGEDELITPEYIEEMIHEADLNGDGHVDLEEFLQVMLGN